MAHKILVVDDEENMRVLLTRVLGKRGYEVECAGSGEAALALAADEHFELAIVDVCMAEMDGIDVLVKLKEINRQMPVIMISAYSSWEKRERAERLGCVGYLSKPLDMKYLKELIKTSLTG
ncbi:MAG: response regulator [Deltaproteobacteria bacterium]|jgi:DNA-binding NtrC family response regulator|nr:response regulator [Deltaproteobacteria bacterium]